MLHLLGTRLTSSLRGTHPCAASPHRHAKHKSWQNDAPKLLRPSSYAHIITTTYSPSSPQTIPFISLCAPPLLNTHELMWALKTGWHRLWILRRMPAITMETLVKYHQFQNDNRAADMGVRSRVEAMKSKRRGMGVYVRFKFRGGGVKKADDLKSEESCE